ncbi:hypothetical protein RUM43_010403 [Polyplax serrata]|uniref:Uncharacterized protein n=1 Tax=Polyplax serrata TaxID=468196 RepID=A0AAN8P9H1_POLSC
MAVPNLAISPLRKYANGQEDLGEGASSDSAKTRGFVKKEKKIYIRARKLRSFSVASLQNGNFAGGFLIKIEKKNV